MAKKEVDGVVEAKSILTALRIIKTVCGDNIQCETCPLGDDVGNCRARNDVLDGIRYTGMLLNEDKIVILDTCVNTIKEFATYMWDSKAADRGEDKPVKQFDHCMDALRYFCYTIIHRRVGITFLK